LRDANLQGADLEWANLKSAKLTNANYQTVKNIERADITDTIGLEKILEEIEESDMIQLNLFEEYRIKPIDTKLRCEPKYQESFQKKYPPALPLISTHTKMQGILAEIGQKLGHRVWIARNDHSKDYRFGKLKELTMKGFPVDGLEKKVEKISKLIDVIWLDKNDQFKVVALFEIECTTAIHLTG